MRKQLLIKLIGILIFIIILVKIDVTKAFSLIGRANLPFLILAAILSFLLLTIRTLRWQAILCAQGHTFGFRELFQVNLGGTYFASATPGQIGEFIKAYHLNKQGKTPVGRSISSIILDRFMNIPFLLIISAIGILFFPLETKMKVALTSFFALSFLIMLLVASNKRLVRKLGRFVLKPKVFKRISGNMRTHFKDFYEGINMMWSAKIAKPLLISLAGLAAVFAQAYILALALYLEIPFIYLCIAVSISTIIALVPVSFLGIGTRDAVLVFLFTSIGLTAESAIGFSFLFLLTNYVFIAVAGAYSWFRHPLIQPAQERKR
ncbi:lysylphosphatidylglycerol synthase transmembrane domain-containing protein [Nanoarchaeota archaeon]